jgi:hypothetical protein
MMIIFERLENINYLFIYLKKILLISLKLDQVYINDLNIRNIIQNLSLEGKIKYNSHQD